MPRFQSLKSDSLLAISFFTPSAPFPPKARGRWGFSDFDDDGIADIAIACASPDSGYLSVLGGQPAGGGAVSFKPAVNHFLGFRPRSLVIRDFNADGAVDIAVARHDANDILVLKQIRPASPRR